MKTLSFGGHLFGAKNSSDTPTHLHTHTPTTHTEMQTEFSGTLYVKYCIAVTAGVEQTHDTH